MSTRDADAILSWVRADAVEGLRTLWDLYEESAYSLARLHGLLHALGPDRLSLVVRAYYAVWFELNDEPFPKTLGQNEDSWEDLRHWLLGGPLKHLVSGDSQVRQVVDEYDLFTRRLVDGAWDVGSSLELDGILLRPGRRLLTPNVVIDAVAREILGEDFVYNLHPR